VSGTSVNQQEVHMKFNDFDLATHRKNQAEEALDAFYLAHGYDRGAYSLNEQAEERRLERLALDAHGSWAELKYGTQ
jgi:hypothetical protein